ncbi:MAG TPA: FAD-binding oxidoreductase [Pelobium sp.]
MANFKVKITEVTPLVTHVFRIRTEKPKNYNFTPGQATEVSLQYEGWENEKRPFTFTCLPEDNYLEFTIKTYEDHEGVTKRIATIAPGDVFEIGDAWGTIDYKGEGVFIAGGAGVTPFLSILRNLNQKRQLGKNQLICSNKFEDEIICFEELKSMLGGRFINTITQQKDPELPVGRIDKEYLKAQISDFNQHFYVCGPAGFTKSILAALKELGAKADGLVFEQ